MHFPNRISVTQYADYVAEEISSLLKVRAIQKWDSIYPITVISGLGVVVNRMGKKCLILDARYINLFDKYESFSCETLSDVPRYLPSGDYIMLTDFKSWYHQVKMHPSTY